MKERGKRTQGIAIAGGKGSEVESGGIDSAVASGSAAQPALVQQAPAERYACGWSAF